MTAVSDAVDTFVGKMVDAARDNAPAVVDAAQADAQGQITDLTTQLADANAELVGLRTQADQDAALLVADKATIADLQAQHTADQATIAQQAARIAELEAELPHPPTQTLYGISVNSEGDVARVEAMAPGIKIRAARRFYTGSLASSFAGDKVLKSAYDSGVRLFHVSWHTPVTAAQLASFKKTVPADAKILMTQDHEPENDNPPWVLADWRAQQKAASELVHAAGFQFWMILMGWTVNPASGRNVEDWWVADGVHNGVAVDIYNKDMSVGLARFKAFADKHGLPFAITETGASTSVHGKAQPQAERVQWAKDAVAAIAPTQPVHVDWWDVGAGTSFDNTLNPELAAAFFPTVSV